MKSNRELFIEELKACTMAEFIGRINSAGRCGMCSNFYWDIEGERCHKDKNLSSCAAGQAEWMASYPHENLQIKYRKKYSCFLDYYHAHIMQKLATFLVAAGAVRPCAEPCGMCIGSGKGPECYTPILLLLKARDAYAEEKTRSFQPAEIRRTLEDRITLEAYLAEAVIPAIEDADARSRAERLLKAAENYKALLLNTAKN